MQRFGGATRYRFAGQEAKLDQATGSLCRSQMRIEESLTGAKMRGRGGCRRVCRIGWRQRNWLNAGIFLRLGMGLRQAQAPRMGKVARMASLSGARSPGRTSPLPRPSGMSSAGRIDQGVDPVGQAAARATPRNGISRLFRHLQRAGAPGSRMNRSSGWPWQAAHTASGIRARRSAFCHRVKRFTPVVCGRP